MRFALATQLIVPFVILYLGSTMLLWLVFSVTFGKGLSRSLEENSGVLVRNLARVLFHPLAMRQTDQVQSILEGATQVDPDISYALVQTPQGEVMASTDKAQVGRTLPELQDLQRVGLGQNGAYELQMPIGNRSMQMGVLRVGISTARTVAVVHRTALASLGVCLLTLVAGIGTYRQLTYHTLSRPLARLVRIVSQVSQGDFALPVEPESLARDEVGQLLRATGSMALYLRELAQVAESIAAGQADVRLAPRREGDKFGLAFNQMVEYYWGEMREVKRLLGEMEQIGRHVASAAQSLAQAARDQETGISQQAAAASEISASSRQIAATARELLASVGGVAQQAEHTARLAQDGRGLLGEMKTALDETLTSVAQVAERLGGLHRKTQRITSVVTTIGKVADQTNLISINASIEAEKAGEAGRGFGVVAAEVRRLADQTATATVEVEDMIGELQRVVLAEVSGMDRFTRQVRQGVGTAIGVVEQLGSIILAVQLIDEEFDKVNHGMQLQTAAGDQITLSIGELSEVTQTTARSIRAFNGVVRSLHEAAQGLSAGVPTGGNYAAIENVVDPLVPPVTSTR